ncbi:MAG: FHA domain-containing protein [Prevotellaceae bacterium]|nr:FHA domain-containing protein [Prevotellaceae bacterium]
MNLREVTIGRQADSDIYIDQRCAYASNRHAIIYYDADQLMYKDTSSNGTMINNVHVKQRAVPIKYGDIIMLAGKYPISWNQICAFFPEANSSSTRNAAHNSGAGNNSVTGDNFGIKVTSNSESKAEMPDLHKWNWGAFLLNWIWSLGNGCWWIFVIYVVLYVCACIPFVNIISSIAALVLSVICGLQGNEWAWNNKQWSSVAEFEKVQATWTKVGVVLVCVCVSLSIISGIGLLAVYL